MQESEDNIVYKAEKIAYKVHDGQVDLVGKPYIFHLCNVAANCETEESKATVFLKDVLKDGNDMDSCQLRKMGIPMKVVRAVKLLTRTSFKKDEYLSELKPNDLAREVKLEEMREILKLNPSAGPKHDEIVHMQIQCRRAIQFLEQHNYYWRDHRVTEDELKLVKAIIQSIVINPGNKRFGEGSITFDPHMEGVYSATFELNEMYFQTRENQIDIGYESGYRLNDRQIDSLLPWIAEYY
jgi:hypothetical protein